MKSFFKIFMVATGLFVTGFNRAEAQPTNAGTMLDRLQEVRRQNSENGSEPLFTFPGGKPQEFVAAAEKQFKVDWLAIATIPNEMENVQVPKLRVRVGQPEELLKLYNRLGEENPAFGKWHWEGKVAGPSVLMLVPVGRVVAVTNTEPPAELIVFKLKYIGGKNLATVAEALSAADEVSQRTERREGRTPVPARVIIDERTGSLLVTASAGSMTLMKSVVRELDVPSYTQPEEPKKNAGGSSGQNRNTNDSAQHQ